MARRAQWEQPQTPVQVEVVPPAVPEAQQPRESPGDVPMYRYIHSIPPASRGCDCGGGRCGGWNPDSAAILEALEQQNRLLTELLGAVTGLTAACLCRSRSE